MRRRHLLLIAIPACVAVLWLASAPAGASRVVPVPAPPASASGVAAQVGSLVDVSRTGATADSNTASSEASVIRITEHPLFGLGGSQQGDGQANGALLDSQSTLPARVQVAPWAASASGSGSATRQGRSSAAVARADVPDLAQAGVLTSDSQATHTDQKSSGTAITDGVQLSVLDAIRLVLLHSEVSSEGGGSSYLLGLNGMEIGTDEQLGASPLCAFEAPGILGLSCLSASGGSGGAVSEAASQVAEITPALDVLSIIDPVAAFTAAATSGTGEPAVAAAPAATAPQATETARATAPDAVSGGSTLPRTGATIASLASIAGALLLLGVAMRRFRLRPAAVVSS
jgi:LPXTG-motif cell wall-anchored protein